MDRIPDVENPSRRLYLAAMTHMDDAIGQVRRALTQESLNENTIIIYFSDNGGCQRWGAGPDYYGGKYAPQEKRSATIIRFGAGKPNSTRVAYAYPRQSSGQAISTRQAH